MLAGLEAVMNAVGESPAEERSETAEEGAAREAMEEANAHVQVHDLVGIYSIGHIGQVQLFYRGELVSPDVSPGPESQSVALFHWDEIPWEELAFPTIRWALRDFEANRNNAKAIPVSRRAELKRAE